VDDVRERAEQGSDATGRSSLIPDQASPSPASTGAGDVGAATTTKHDEHELATTITKHDRHEHEHLLNARVRRHLLLLSLANWAIAVVAWTVSAFLGISSPASIMVYTVLFIVGLFAVLVALAAYVIERFAYRPDPIDSQTDEGDQHGTAPAPPA
jgi:cation transporter-like permease